jgi:uncharacterized protein
MIKSFNDSTLKFSTAKIIILTAMALVSLTNIFGINAAGMSVLLGIGAFIIFKIIEKQTLRECGLDVKSIKKTAKAAIWIWVALPTIINVLVIFIAKLMIPDYISHVMSRSEIMLSFDKLSILIVQIVLFALAEEVAWRGFFQKQIQSIVPALPAIIGTSVIFSLGHLTSGSLMIVAYDLVFVFINSLIYGAVFKKTNNIWLCTISHFLANFSAVIILFFL